MDRGMVHMGNIYHLFYTNALATCICHCIYSLIAAWICRLICGISWQIEGKENIPLTPCTVASNHQSTWETFYLQTLFTPQATVLKQELFKIPFFGWALRTLKPIAIDRNNPKQAMKHMNKQGKHALDNGLWVMIFPEGTRHNWPEIGRYTRGAATLALKADTPVLPVVHNAGKYWPNKKWLKTPGKIVIKIGKPITTEGRTAKAISEELEAWTQDNLPV